MLLLYDAYYDYDRVFERTNIETREHHKLKIIKVCSHKICNISVHNIITFTLIFKV